MAPHQKTKMSRRTASFVRKCLDCSSVWYHPSNCDSKCPRCNPNFKSSCLNCGTIWHHAEQVPTMCPSCVPVKFRHHFDNAHESFEEIYRDMHVWLNNLDLIELDNAQHQLWLAKKRLKKVAAKVEKNQKDFLNNKLLFP